MHRPSQTLGGHEMNQRTTEAQQVCAGQTLRVGGDLGSCPAPCPQMCEGKHTVSLYPL